MSKQIVEIISKELELSAAQVNKTISMLQEGATLPFIARYRKEATGGLDDVQIGNIQNAFEKLQDLEKRKKAVVKSIQGQGKLSIELKNQILQSFDSNELEDLYLPFKQKRQTRAELARKGGLEALAKIIMGQHEHNVMSKVDDFVCGDIKSKDQAIQGSIDIMAEWINESKEARTAIRQIFSKDAFISSKVVKSKQAEAEKYKDYFKFEEKLSRCKSHRFLALRRGEAEKYLKLSIRPDEEICLDRLNRIFIKNDVSGLVEIAVKESYKRLLAPSIENEFWALAKNGADEEAIIVFAENLRQLLLGAPLGKKRVLAIDPGFKSGCKIVCLDETGELIHNETIYPHPPQNKTEMAVKKIHSLVDSCKIEAIAIGNGTAGRETENLIRKMKFRKDVEVYIVSEAGASIYSASAIAREEFPQYDVTVRGSVSIGRRLVDPLAELVKIEAKSIGVGQYQHDVDQKMLQKSLNMVVESCVNKVGVDLNTASRHLLMYVSGLGTQLAQNVIDYRKEKGRFTSREELKNVPRMGDKAFEQCAGFLRVKDGENPLDDSAVHPESYKLVGKMAKKLKVKVDALIRNEDLVKQIDTSQYLSDAIGAETLADILKELKKPGLDPRKKAKVFEFAKGITAISDLHIGMVIPGIVTNITNFGAFIDVGVKQDGLVHISNLANEFISNPANYVTLHQQVKVKVLEVDAPRKRIGLSMKDV